MKSSNNLYISYNLKMVYIPAEFNMHTKIPIQTYESKVPQWS